MAKKPPRTKRLKAYVASPAETEADKAALRVQKALTNETARGRILVAAEYASELLKQLLTSAMVSNTQADKLLGRDRPLSSFGMRIRAAFAFGLLPETMAVNLDHLRDIRNHCGHSIGEVNADDEELLAGFKRIHVPPQHLAAMGNMPTLEAQQLEILAFIIGSLEGWVMELKPELARWSPIRHVGKRLTKDLTAEDDD